MINILTWFLVMPEVSVSPVSQEVIDLEPDSDLDDDYEDRVREDVYEDYDELADFAVTAASAEPPPPGTRVKI